jgi:hypothetical protein
MLSLFLILASMIGVTVLGWAGISQIRHSAGRYHGLALAVFDGLLFPLLLLDGLLLALPFIVLKTFPPAKIWLVGLMGLAALAAAVWLDFVVVRRVWGAVNGPHSSQPAAGATTKRFWPALAIALGCLVLSYITIVLLTAPWRAGGSGDVAHSPDKLRRLPNAEVIAAGVRAWQEPWPWHELQERGRAGRLSMDEGNQILDQLAARFRHDFPNGCQSPLPWLGELLREFPSRELFSEPQVLDFLQAYHGNPSIGPLPRLREGAPILVFECRVHSPWERQLLGFQLMNEERAITLDGQPVSLLNKDRRDWRREDDHGEIDVSKLAPGRHVVRWEFESALVPSDDLAGLDANTEAKDWPPARRRWTRAAETAFTVYPQDAEIVRLADDPALNPLAAGAVSVERIIIRPKKGQLSAILTFHLDPKPGAPVSCAVTLRVGGQSVPCGSLWAAANADGSRETGNGEMTADLAPLDAQTRQAEVILTPDPKAAEPHPGVNVIWGKEIVFRDVPVTRQDAGR